ncbi:MAG TPA: hypothetical protein VHO02_06030 [Fibrobacteria bacterium]|jgi:hypothetical protein|nr:hypothetical protein [Fibrobacteria bacterium]
MLFDMHLHRLPILLLACVALLAACGKKESPAPSVKLDSWQGTWVGPEGTYLKLTAKPGAGYDVVIKDLDGERSFEGAGRADRILFTRDGLQEQIQATDGNGTGMKWLAGKSECLTVKPGEGYCRD